MNEHPAGQKSSLGIGFVEFSTPTVLDCCGRILNSDQYPTVIFRDCRALAHVTGRVLNEGRRSTYGENELLYMTLCPRY